MKGPCHMSATTQPQPLTAVQLAQLRRHQLEYMIDGRSMTFAQFLDEVCPDPEDPTRTYLTLKYKK